MFRVIIGLFAVWCLCLWGDLILAQWLFVKLPNYSPALDGIFWAKAGIIYGATFLGSAQFIVLVFALRKIDATKQRH